MDIDAEIDRLYGVPLDEFVSERDELARRLNRGGDRDAGARIKALRKPTVGAWALNQAVRRRRSETDALLETGQRLREAHEGLLAGSDPAALRATMEEERSLTSALADCAEVIATETGKSGAALRDRVRATLHAAAVDAEAREELAGGRFVREREAVGLGTFGMGLPPSDAAGAGAAPRRTRSAARRDRASAKPAGGAKVARTKPAPSPDPRLAEAERTLAEAREALAHATADHAATASTVESTRTAMGEAELAEREARRVMRELGREVAKQERKVERMRPKR